MITNRTLRYVFFFLLLGIVGVLTFLIFLPYLNSIAIATAFAVVSQPLYKALLRICKGYKTPAAFLTILVIGIVVLAPLSLLGIQLVQEASSLYDAVGKQEGFPGEVISQLQNQLQTYLRQFIPGLALDFGSMIRQMLGWIPTHVAPIFSATFFTIINFFFGLIAFYYMLKDGDRFLRIIVQLSPLKDKDDRSIFNKLSVAINTIIRGSILIALIQGVLSGIGFAVAGVPSATLWGGLASLAALIPGVGAFIVIIPAILYLFVVGDTIAGIGLTIWAVGVVGTIDNVLRPLFVGRGVNIHPLFVLFAVIGGTAFFGPSGILLGPLTLSLLYALLDIYQSMVIERGEAP